MDGMPYFSRSPTSSAIASAMRAWPAVDGCRRSVFGLLIHASCARTFGKRPDTAWRSTTFTAQTFPASLTAAT